MLTHVSLFYVQLYSIILSAPPQKFLLTEQLNPRWRLDVYIQRDYIWGPLNTTLH